MSIPSTSHESFHVLPPPHVRGHHQGAPSGVDDGLGALLQMRLGPRCQTYRRARRRQRDGDGPAEAPAGAGDHGDPARQRLMRHGG
jgi:hypothetical protein